MTRHPLTFTSPLHDRAAVRRNDLAWLDQRWQDPSSRVVLVEGFEVVVDPVTGLVKWIGPDEAGSGERYLLGIDDDGCAVFAMHRTPVGRPEPGPDWVEPGAPTRGLRELAVSSPASDVQWLCHAVALAQWHANHPHCARCGAATEVAAEGAERRCLVDGSAHFPRVDPAVIVLVTDERDRALLGRQAMWPEGRYSTLAGFVEPGESAEHAVVREVAEESGVTVRDVQLLATQPWPFPSSLMIGARATAEGTPEPRADGDELSDVRWFSRADLAADIAAGSVQVPGSVSISRWLIEGWFDSDLPDDGAGWR